MPRLSRPALALILLGLLTAISIVCFMTLGAKGSWSFVLGFRGKKLASLLLVAYAVAVSTVLFQTVTNNRILTPSIMGFDALYVLIKTGVVFFLGVGALISIDPQLQFGLEVLVMVAFSGLLFRWLFLGEERSLHLLVLVGIVFGILFRSLSQFMQDQPGDQIGLFRRYIGVLCEPDASQLTAICDYVEAGVLALPRVLINGGQRGFLVGIAPQVLSTLVAAKPVHCALAG